MVFVWIYKKIFFWKKCFFFKVGFYVILCWDLFFFKGGKYFYGKCRKIWKLNFLILDLLVFINGIFMY